MTPATFTVVMPAHNAEATVGSAIRSVLRQTRQDFELVVVDDGSTDSTRDRVGEFLGDPRLRMISQAQCGPAAARNAGIRAGVGELVSMLDADDLWLPTYLDQMDAALRSDGQAGLAYTNAWVLDEPPGKIRRRLALRHEPAVPPQTARGLMLRLARQNFIYTAATVRRAVLADAGDYDERFRHGEDHELWLRIASRGYRAVRAPGVLAVHRDHAASLTSDTAMALGRAIELYAAIAVEHGEAEVRQIAAGTRADLEGMLLRLTQPSLRVRAETFVAQVYRRWIRRSPWFEEPPEDVARLLASVSR